MKKIFASFFVLVLGAFLPTIAMAAPGDVTMCVSDDDPTVGYDPGQCVAGFKKVDMPPADAAKLKKPELSKKIVAPSKKAEPPKAVVKSEPAPAPPPAKKETFKPSPFQRVAYVCLLGTNPNMQNGVSEWSEDAALECVGGNKPLVTLMEVMYNCDKITGKPSLKGGKVVFENAECGVEPNIVSHLTEAPMIPPKPETFWTTGNTVAVVVGTVVTVAVIVVGSYFIAKESRDTYDYRTNDRNTTTERSALTASSGRQYMEGNLQIAFP